MLKVSDVVKNSIQATSIKYNTLVYELKQRGVNPIVLSLGEAFFDIPLQDMSQLPFPQLYHYTHSRGVIGLRKKICDYYKKMYFVDVDAESEILITAGSKAVIYFALRSTLNPGDEAIIPEPAWVSYSEQVKLCYANPIMIPHWESVFNYEKYITTKSKIIIINNPNNPSGKIYSQKELAHLVNLATKNNLFILSDEAYSDFLLNNKDFFSLGIFDIDKKNIIICNSISKNFGISGWRIGYAITNKNLLDEILKLNQHIITCPATILEFYLEKYFDEIINVTYPQIKTLINVRTEIAKFMDSIELKYLPGSATFYFFVSILPSALNSEDFCTRLLLEECIATVPGIGYGQTCDKFIRISVGTESTERVKFALTKIKSFIQKTSIQKDASIFPANPL